MQPARILDLLSAFGRNVITSLETELIPRRCVFCGVVSANQERFICAGCFADLPWIQNSCPTCALELPGPQPDGVGCARCQSLPPPFVSAVAPLSYAFPVDAAIKALKFRRRYFFIPAFADILLANVGRLPNDIDAILPVPLHRWRQLGRGFNQAAELARPIATATSLPLIHNVRRVLATPYQSGLDSKARRTNLKSAFQLKGRIDARHVLIVDDVITTGETCRQLAFAVLAGGAEQVSVIALARA